MTKYIPKDVLLAEIERTQKRLNIDDVGGCSVMAWSEGFKNFINTLEVKEVDVSDDLEDACEQLAENARIRKAETISRFFSPTDYKQGVIDGTKWKEQQMMAKAVDGKVIANGMGNPILHLWDKGRHLIDKKVKVIVIKEE